MAGYYTRIGMPPLKAPLTAWRVFDLRKPIAASGKNRPVHREEMRKFPDISLGDLHGERVK
jgi:hypothetical protein